MGHIKKFTTLLLLLLLVVSVSVFAGMVVYYQKNLSKMNSVLGEKNVMIGQLNGILESSKRNYTQVFELLQLKVQREQDLTAQYTDVKTEKEDLETDKQGLSKNLNSTKSVLNSALLNISKLQDSVATLDIEVDKLNAQVSDIKNDTRYICSRIEGQINLTRCEDYQ